MSSDKNIIFDFGGVIINIDYRLTAAAFQNLGIQNFDEQYSKLTQSHLFDELEKGIIPASVFRDRIREQSGLAFSDQQIDDAWNAMLLDLPADRIDFLLDLKTKRRIFLLSNTNEIHERAFMKMIHEKFGKDILTETFEHVYFSHRIKMRKPDLEIFQHVLTENNLLANETLFVDDSDQHIKGAMEAGLSTYYFEKGKTLYDVVKL